MENNIINLMKEPNYKPMHMKDLMRCLSISKKERNEFKDLLKELVRQDKIIKTKRNRYGLPKKINLVTGKLQGHSAGYGFVIPDDEKQEDVFVAPKKLNTAMHNDRVIVHIDSFGKEGKRAGKIVRILERGYQNIVGKYEKQNKFGYVIPVETRLSRPIYISPENSLNAESGQMVVVNIINYFQGNRNPEGKIIKILGALNEPGIETEIIVQQYELPHKFPKKVIFEADNCPQEVNKDSLKNRLDLRNVLTVTIDGESAKDFDDAVSIEILPNKHYKLMVHIADVSYYVALNSQLDEEAYLRGTSVYFPDRVIPMLPPKLSNGICSLNPQVDRLTISVVMEFNQSGEMVKHDFYESVINSNERLTYTAVKGILIDEDKELNQQYAHIVPTLKQMQELCKILTTKRRKRGSLDFDLPEAEIIIDLQGRIQDIVKSERHIGHRIIEEFMIAANETVASHLDQLGISSLYRVHEKPDTEKVADFKEFIGKFGYHLNSSANLTSKTFQKLLEETREKPEEKLINYIMLRSMKQARYSSENIGHFGLASEYYTHFTSPIRRYPDLVVHRILREVIKKEDSSTKVMDKIAALLPEIAAHSSARERIADEAEREAVDFKKAQFMQDKINDSFEGFITGVTNYGFFAELEGIFIEGMVHISKLTDDYYIYNEEQHALIGERTKNIFQIGDKVAVKVLNVNLEKRQVDFLLIKKISGK